MHTVLIFDGDESYDAHVAQRGGRYLEALQEVYRYFHQLHKHGSYTHIPTKDVIDEINNILSDCRIGIYDDMP